MEIGIVTRVNDSPEEPVDGGWGPDDEGRGGDPDESGAPQRGWIDPEDRLWRHPSELAVPAGSSAVRLNPPPRPAGRSTAMALVGVAAVVAVAAWMAVLLSPASQPPQHATGVTSDVGDAPLTTLAGAQNSVPAAAQAAGHSVVALEASTVHGTVLLIGVAVAEGGLVATTADLLAGVRTVTVVEPDGQRARAPVIATDSTSDIALVEVPEDLPVAHFADDGGLAAGTADLTLGLVPVAGAGMALQCTPGSVTGVGQAIATGPAGGMPSITSSSAPSVAAGQPLLDTAGAVVGILYDPALGSGGSTTFLPSGLVVGVADQLRSQQKVLHGWLGVSGTDAAAGSGAKVESVDPKGPAVGHVSAGQVIVGVDSLPVRTMAELRARLYVLAPGDSVALSVEQPTGARLVVDVTLSGSS